jgi:hypothetical protein
LKGYDHEREENHRRVQRDAQRELGDPQRWVDIFVKNHRDLAKRVYVRAGTELEMPEPGFDPSANFDPSGN